MNTTSLQNDIAQVSELVRNKQQAGRRTIIGITGPPASGKSTLAEAVVQKLNVDNDSSIPKAALLSMDGYHLDNSILESRGLIKRKGAPETFDAYGFCEAVKQLAMTEREIYFPKFDRRLDLAIANAILVHPDTPIVIVEGNYLLLKDKPWLWLGDIFAATVFICPPLELLQQRLQKRWIDHGLDPEAAMTRATSNDLVNTELIIQQSRDADMTLKHS